MTSNFKRAMSSMPVLVLVLGCTQTTADQKTLAFSAITVPSSSAEKGEIRASDEVSINGKPRRIGYHELLRTNQVLLKLAGNGRQTEVFGLLKDKDGRPLMEEDGSPWVCTNGSGPDHTSLLRFGKDNLFAVTQLECDLGGAYVTKLHRERDGNLTAVATRSVDFSHVFGTYVNCAGMTTPWNTHLGSEEYELPMALFDASAEGKAWFSDSTHNHRMQAIADYHKIDNIAENAAYLGYRFGWIPEISVTSSIGDTRVAKHFSMGRFAHELGYVMPDERTVYLSDDGANTGLFLYVADRKADLSAGMLYAARWNQTSGEGVGSADIAWVSLGHATDKEIRRALDQKVTFNDLFELAEPLDKDAGTCPEGFTSTNTYDEGLLCSRVKPGQALPASRLETRLYAAHRGATTEFRKEEGLAFNPDDGILYIAMSEVRYGMEDKNARDIGGPNHIRLAKANKCGAVYGMKVAGSVRDTDGAKIDSAYVGKDMFGVVAGTPKDYSGTELSENTCDVDGIASPDNLTYLPGYKSLIIGEDTSGHQNDAVWSYDVRNKTLTRIATTPYGAETTSPFWHQDIHGFGYLTLVTQHPYGESDQDKAASPADKESHVGYIGPFPSLK